MSHHGISLENCNVFLAIKPATREKIIELVMARPPVP